MDSTWNESDAPTAYNKVSLYEKEVRHAFVRKVYSILSLQLLITFGFVAIAVHVESVRNFVQQNAWLLYLALGLSLAFIIGLACFKQCRYNVPLNYFVLFAFTCVEAYLVGTVASFYNSVAVLQAVGITFGIFIGLTIFTIQSKYDFSGMGPYLFAALLGLLIFGMIRLFFPENRVVETVYGFLGAAIFSLYIIYDTSNLMNRLSIDEYVAGALHLYLDIINLFLFVLSLFSRGNN